MELTFPFITYTAVQQAMHHGPSSYDFGRVVMITMHNGEKIYCERFIAKAWIICQNFSTSKSLISFKTLVQGNMLHE